MTDRPKIRIVKKSDPPRTPIVEAPTPIIEERQPVDHEPEQVVAYDHQVAEEVQETTQNYDDFAKPIPWTKIGVISGVIISLLALVFFFIVPMFGGENITEDAISESTEINSTSDKNGFYIKDQLPEGSDKIEDILSRNMSFRDLLISIGIPKSDIRALEDEGNKYSIRRLVSGDKYTLAHKKDQPKEFLMLMIEPKKEPYSFYKIDLSNQLEIEKLDKQVEIRETYIAAIVEGTLGQTFVDNNLNLKLISSIEEVLAWSVDLFDVGDGDRFKVLYDEEYVNGRANRVSKIKALYFEKDRKPHYAFNYNEGENGYFSEFGQSMERSFLATPIKYGGVITSGFGLRTHPVTGNTKDHKGTDFAAPEGTPIQAVADGVVTLAQFKSNNGNYVKIRHDKTYETQYLHMQKWADGIRKGSRVKQGDIIGYVGSTGLSTGPHVCFRFWKDLKQVNPAAENLASGKKISPKKIQNYYKHIEPLRERIKEINYF